MLAGVFAWCIEGWQLYLLLRPQILLFFLVGVLAFRFSLNTFVERLPMLPVTAAFAVIGAGKCWLSIWGQHHQISQPEMVAVVDNVLRIVAAVFFWKLSVRLAASGPAGAVQRPDAYTFLLFLFSDAKTSWE